MPMNIVEGMLLSKPVAASYNRGHCELIVPDVTGYMVPPADVDAFAEKILLLLNDLCWQTAWDMPDTKKHENIQIKVLV